MRQSDHSLPLEGANSDPVLYGIAHGLAEMFPPVEPLASRDEQIEETEYLEQAA